MSQYVYIEHIKGKQLRHSFDTIADAIGFGNMHYNSNPDVDTACIVKPFENTVDLSQFVRGKVVKTYK